MLKFNANQRYATTAITAAMLREVASRGGVPMQEVIVRNDSHCGPTIGPMLSAKLGLWVSGRGFHYCTHPHQEHIVTRVSDLTYIPCRNTVYCAQYIVT